MGTGYTRQSSGGIQDGNTIEASDFNAEYNQLEDAFNDTTGHAHDGTTGNGPKISLTAGISGILPLANGGTGSSTLTADEVAQIENIGATTIGATQWGYLGAFDQGLTTASNVQFNQVSTDTIVEETAAAGVTIDGALLKDGGATFGNNVSISKSGFTSLTIDGDATSETQLVFDGNTAARIKNNVAQDIIVDINGTVVGRWGTTGALNVDTVGELTAAAGVTIDGALLKDGYGVFSGSDAIRVDMVRSGTNNPAFRMGNDDGSCRIFCDPSGGDAGDFEPFGTLNWGNSSSPFTSGSFTTGYFGAGAAATPSVTFTTDTDTGAYLKAAGQIAFTLGGTSSYLFASTALQPEDNGVKRLGGSSNRWTTVYAEDVDLSGNATIGGFLNVGTATSIPAGMSLTVSKSFHIVDTNAGLGLATTTINGASAAGDILYLTTNGGINGLGLASGGNIECGAGVTFPPANTTAIAKLLYDGTNWKLVSFEQN